MKRSRSGQNGAAASYFRCRVNSAVAMSAAPIGRPGWPDFACSTASMASARIAFAIRSCSARGMADDAMAAWDEFGGVIWQPIARRGDESNALRTCGWLVLHNSRRELWGLSAAFVDVA